MILKITYEDSDGDKCDIDIQDDMDIALDELREKQSIHFFVEFHTPREVSTPKPKEVAPFFGTN